MKSAVYCKSKSKKRKEHVFLNGLIFVLIWNDPVQLRMSNTVFEALPFASGTFLNASATAFMTTSLTETFRLCCSAGSDHIKGATTS